MTMNSWRQNARGCWLRILALAALGLSMTGCSGEAAGTRMIKTPSGREVVLERAPAEEVWIFLDDAKRRAAQRDTVLTHFGLQGWAAIAKQFDDATAEADRAVAPADVPEQLFDQLRDTVVQQTALELPAIARKKERLQFLYVGQFTDGSDRSVPELESRLQSAAQPTHDQIQRHHLSPEGEQWQTREHSSALTSTTT